MTGASIVLVLIAIAHDERCRVTGVSVERVLAPLPATAVMLRLNVFVS